MSEDAHAYIFPLPDPAGVLPHHGLACLAAESLLELRHVLHHAGHTIFSRRMRIYTDQHARELGTALFAPGATEAEEEALLRGVAADGLRRWASVAVGHHLLQRHQGDPRPAVVGGVLAQGEAAIEFEIVHRHETAVLVGDATGALFEFRAVLRRPPVAQIALRVELASLIVEAVGQLVADDNPDATEVRGIVNLLVEKRRLQNTRREHNFILRRTVVGIDRRWRHLPFVAVNRLADFGNLAAGFKLVGSQEISHEIAARNFQRTVIAPDVGISNLVANRVQLQFGLLLRLFGHPGQVADVLIQTLL